MEHISSLISVSRIERDHTRLIKALKFLQRNRAIRPIVETKIGMALLKLFCNYYITKVSKKWFN